MEINKMKYRKVNPIAAAILLSLPLVVHADVIIKNGTANVVNGVPVIDIAKPNANGISHNTYDKLNVGKEGMVFNNSQAGVATTLAGQIAGNASLSEGAAKVILNEVTARNRSTLSGSLEVGGDKAHLIIANPSGITCTSCGFINTDKVTLTTGKPDMQGGVLQGYSVNGGDIKVDTSLSNDSPTAILTRSAVINGNINISNSELSLITGNNYVDTDNNVTKTVSATGSRGWYSLDVAKLGGMYAKKITLVSTENGVGVRNAGIIGAGSNGLKLDAKGQLINSNAQLKSSGDIAININGNLDNVTGKIISDKSVYIETQKRNVNNSRAGNILAGQQVAVSSGAFDNTNGRVAATDMLAINTNGNTLTNYGKGKTVGLQSAVVALDTRLLNNNNGQISGYYVGVNSDSFNNIDGSIDAIQDIEIKNKNNINNNRGLIRTTAGSVKISTNTGTLWNNQTRTADASSSDSLGIIAGEGGIDITSGRLENDGQILSSGNVTINSTAQVQNAAGKINSSKAITINAASMDNSRAGLVATGDVNIVTTGAIENYIGGLSSEEGTVNLKGQRVYNYGGLLLGNDINIETTGDFNNNTALLVANRDLTIRTGGTFNNSNGNNFGRNFGLYFGMSGQVGGTVAKNTADITANNVNNNNSRIVTSADMKLNAKSSLNNSNAMIRSGGNISISASSVNNNYATISSAGNLNVDAKSLSMYSNGNIIDNNATGIIASDEKDVNLNVVGNIENYGYISGAKKVTLTTQGVLYNRNSIYSDDEVILNVSRNIFNYKDILGVNKLTVTAGGNVVNTGNMLSYGKYTLNGI